MVQNDGAVEKVLTGEQTDFRFLAENSADVICRADMDTIMRYVSPSCVHLLGWSPQEIVGRPAGNFVFPEDLPLLGAAVAQARAPGNATAGATLRMLKKDGSVCWVETNARVVRDAATGESQEVVVVVRDISERKLLEEKLLALALTDGLTGLANRRAFDAALDREWSHTLREGSQMSLLMIDIDHFKQFNDRHGHQFGDDCLRAVAAAIRDGVRREIDTVARYGGEEIAVILPCTDSDGALYMAETVRRAIEALRIPHPGNPEAGGWVSASIGVATALARHGGTLKMPESLLMSADHSLYKAKHEGRNRVVTTLLMASQEDLFDTATVPTGV